MTPAEPSLDAQDDVAGTRIVQIVLGSGNLPFAKHLHSTVFGFAGASERLTCSEHNGEVMGFSGWGGAIERVKEAGLAWTVAQPASFIGGNHAIGAVAHHMKTLSVPHDLERQFGFSPELGRWWRPVVHATLEQS